MPDEKIEVNYVRWRLGNSYKCKELLASFLTALSLIYAFYLIAVSPPPAQKWSFPLMFICLKAAIRTFAYLPGTSASEYAIHST